MRREISGRREVKSNLPAQSAARVHGQRPPISSAGGATVCSERRRRRRPTDRPTDASGGASATGRRADDTAAPGCILQAERSQPTLSDRWRR